MYTGNGRRRGTVPGFDQKPLQGSNGDRGLINAAPRAGLLAGLVAYPAQNPRQGIGLHDRGQRSIGLASVNLLDVSLTVLPDGAELPTG